jgi:WXXGXW repeat (2 copies)
MLKNKVMVMCSVIALTGLAAAPAMARVNLDFDVNVAPPAPRVEVVPAPREGYTWSPGYWNWEDGQHVWVDGYWQADRVGFSWTPDRGEGRHFTAGHWERRR